MGSLVVEILQSRGMHGVVVADCPMMPDYHWPNCLSLVDVRFLLEVVAGHGRYRSPAVGYCRRQLAHC